MCDRGDREALGFRIGLTLMPDIRGKRPKLLVHPFRTAISGVRHPQIYRKINKIPLFYLKLANRK